MTAQSEVAQRDLHNRSEEIRNAAQDRQGQLIPSRRRRRFVPRGDFAAMSRTTAQVCLDAFRAEQEATAEQEAFQTGRKGRAVTG